MVTNIIAEKQGISNSLVCKVYEKLKPFISAKKWFLACSGGRDSCVLMHILFVLKQQYSLPAITIIHVNHRLSVSANHWAEFVSQCASQYAFNLINEVVLDQPALGDSVEAWARQARYKIVSKHIKKNCFVMTAHHQRDQAETFLLQSVRAGEIHNLAAMPFKRRMGQGFLVRPMLGFSHDSIVCYAQQFDIAYVTDESNLSERFERNYVRMHVLPAMQRRWPNIDAQLMMVVQNLQKTYNMLYSLMKPFFYRALNSDGQSLNLPYFCTLNHEKQEWILYYWLSILNVRPPSKKTVIEMIRQLTTALSYKQVSIQWSYAETCVAVRRYRTSIFLVNVIACLISNPIEMQWDLSCPLKMGYGDDIMSDNIFTEKQRAHFGDIEVYVRFSQGARLKKFWQSKGIPAWCRNSLPIFCINGNQLKNIDYSKLITRFHYVVPQDILDDVDMNRIDNTES